MMTMKLDNETLTQIHNLALLGMTDEEIAESLEIEKELFGVWVAYAPGVKVALKRGRDVADGHVAAGLYHRAIGYSHPDEKLFQYEGEVIRAETTKQYPPDTKAAEIWLNRRRGGKWDNKQNIHHSGEISFEQAVKQFEGDP